jgi:hypothetical protein
MARGRMITNEIAKDKRINDLSDDTSRLAFTWLITFADVEGRTNGDPALVRSMLFPRRTDITLERMEGYIREWANIGLIQWYQAAGDLWISFPSFAKNQVGLRKNREPKSSIPQPPPDEHPANIRQSSGSLPADDGSASRLIKENQIKLSPDGEKESPEQWFDAREIPQEPHEPRSKEELLAGVAEALAANGRRQDAGEADLSWLDECYRPLALEFITHTGIEPLKSEQTYWRKTLGEFRTVGIDPPDVKKAVKKSRDDGMTIKSPASIFGAARDFAKIRQKSGGDEQWTEVHR